MKTFLKQLYTALLAFGAYLLGRQTQSLKQAKESLEAELKAKERYDKAEAEIKHKAQVAKATLPNDWPESGVVELHIKNGKASNQLTRADLLDVRD